MESTRVPLLGWQDVPVRLRNITLDNVLAGATCSPIGLADFSTYLSFVENSLPSLQFVVWYQSYRQRFFALPKAVQALSPTNADADGNRLSRATVDEDDTSTMPSSPPNPSSPPVSPALLSPFSSAPAIEHTQQPFSAEIDRIVATFLSFEAVKNLRLPEETRAGALRGLYTTTHPDVLVPAYDIAFAALRDGLPRFLAQSVVVANRPSQRFMYARGSMTLTVGLAVFLATLLAAAQGPAHLSEAGIRGLRLLVFPFVVLGALDILQAVQGHCGITARFRGKTQLRPWELTAASGDEKTWWAGVMEDADDAPNAASDRLANAENGRAALKPDPSIPASLSIRACRHAGRVKDQLLADLATLELPTIRRVRSARRAAPAPVVISFTRATTVAVDSSLAADGSLVPPHTPSRQSSTMTLHADFSEKQRPLSSVDDLKTPPFPPAPRNRVPVPVSAKDILDPRMLATHRRIELIAFLTSLAIALVVSSICVALPVVRL